MIFDAKTYCLEQVCSRDVTREHIANVHLDVDRKQLLATDGHCLAMIPCTPEPGDRSGPIPPAALRALRAAIGRYSSPGRMRVRKVLIDCGRLLFKRPKATSFPPVDKVMPDFKRGDPGTVTFGISAESLLRLARALGKTSRRPHVVLTVKVPGDGKPMHEPIIVDPDDKTGATGLIMPARIG